MKPFNPHLVLGAVAGIPEPLDLSGSQQDPR